MGKDKSSGEVYLQRSSTLLRLISVPQLVLKPPQVRQNFSQSVNEYRKLAFDSRKREEERG